jgi:hemoglobin
MSDGTVEACRAAGGGSVINKIQATRSHTMASSLFERLGGIERINALAHEVLVLHMNNPGLRSRFEGLADRSGFERSVAGFFCAGRDGPATYTGEDVLSAHRRLRCNEQELGAAIDDIAAAMTRHGYSPSVQNDALAIL